MMTMFNDMIVDQTTYTHSPALRYILERKCWAGEMYSPFFSNLVSGWVRRAMASGTPSCRLPPPLRGLKKRGVHLALRNAYFEYIIDACEAGTLSATT